MRTHLPTATEVHFSCDKSTTHGLNTAKALKTNARSNEKKENGESREKIWNIENHKKYRWNVHLNHKHKISGFIMYTAQRQALHFQFLFVVGGIQEKKLSGATLAALWIFQTHVDMENNINT